MKVNSDPRDTTTRRQYLTVLPSHFDDGKIGRNHVYENTSVKSVVEKNSKGNSEVDSTIQTVVMDMVNMVLLPDTPKVELGASTRVMPAVCLVERMISGVRKSVV